MYSWINTSLAWLQKEFTKFRLSFCCRSAITARSSKTAIDFSKYSIFADTPNSETSLLERDEIVTYLSLAPPSSTKSVLEVWKDFKQTLPRLHALALKIFCTQAASSPSERLFSDAGNIFTEKRSLLSSTKLDDLLFLKWNL